MSNKALTPAEIAEAQIAFIPVAIGCTPFVATARRDEMGTWRYLGKPLRGERVGPGVRFYRTSEAAKRYAERYLVPMGAPWRMPV